MLYPLSYGRAGRTGPAGGRRSSLPHGAGGKGPPQAIELPPSTWSTCPTRWSEAALHR